MEEYQSNDNSFKVMPTVTSVVNLRALAKLEIVPRFTGFLVKSLTRLFV